MTIPRIQEQDLPSDYKQTVTKLVNLIQKTLEKTFRIVNRIKIELYWEMAKIIVEKQELSSWGDETIKYLALDLRSRFQGIKGISTRNLWRIRRFYIEYRENLGLFKLVKEIGWTHNNIILENIQKYSEREFYLRMCIREKWSSRELKKQIDRGLFERLTVAKNTKKILHTIPKVDNHFLAHFKDEYIFDFLELEPGYNEKKLCSKLTEHMREFLRELGRGFMFGGDEYLLQIGSEEFRIDMLFFHRELRCLVAVEFKIGKFKPSYLGQLEFYLAALDEKETLSHENPAVGLLLCKEKDNEVVRLAMNRTLSPIKISSYKTGLPDEMLLSQKLHSLALPNEMFDENKTDFNNLHELVSHRQCITPKEAKNILEIDDQKLLSERRKGQREGWLKIKGKGRATCYIFVDRPN